jgi:predicted permease
MKWPWRKRDEELNEEIRAHLEMAAREREERGESSDAARAAARREFGNVGLVKETTREMWGWASLERLWQDVRYGLRMMGRSPGFTTTAILSLAIGIGANATVFSWIRGVLLNPLPGAAQPERVVALETLTPSGEWVPTSYLDYRDIRDRVKLIESMSVTQPADLALGTGQNTEQVWGEMVSGNFFEVLRVKPEAGRFFEGAERDDTQNDHAVAVISHSLWQSHYNADPAILGAVVHINRAPYTIIGVAPKGFHGSMPGLKFDIWVPATMYGQLTGTGDWMLKDRKARMFRVLARLASGASIEQATGEVKSIAALMAELDADTNANMSATLVPMWKSHYGVQDALRVPLAAVMGVCGVVLLIVCANIANLLLARATSRSKEFCIRLALGAPRTRLVRQLLTETSLLAGAGAALGLLLTAWLKGSISLLNPVGQNPLVAQPPMDHGVLLFTVLLASAVVFLAGLAPALHATGENINEMLKEGGRSGTSDGRAQRLRGLLVTSEVALAVIALVGAGLCVKSFYAARAIQPGFDPDHVALVRFSLTTAGYSAAQADSFCLRLRDRLERQPETIAVSYADSVPLGFEPGSWEDLKIEGYVPKSNENMKIYRNLVAPGYFAMMKIPIVEGRDFDLRDTSESQPVTIVTEEFVRRFERNENPIGRKVHGWGKWFTIVGVVADTKIHQVTENPIPYFYVPIRYVPIRQIYRPEMGLTFYMRTSGPVNEAMTAILREAQSIDPALPVYQSAPLTEYIAESLFPQRVAASLLGVLGGIGLVLAAIGVYSVMAYFVAQRTNEIGIRMALGAEPRDVVAMVMRQALVLVLPGLLMGALGAAALARVASAAIVAVSPLDPSVYAAVCGFTMLIALAATAIPALRATKVDPMVALRYE